MSSGATDIVEPDPADPNDTIRLQIVRLQRRFLVVFAFLQTMHYVVWVGFLPRVAPETTQAFERRWPTLTTGRIWLVGLAAAVLLGALLLSDYRQGKTVYAGLATYHAYLEFPVLLVLLVRGRLS